MHDLRDPLSLDPKAAAKRLRAALKDRKIDLSHGACLDLVAQMQGLRDWNMFAARMTQAEAAPTGIVTPAGWRLGGAHLMHYAGGLDSAERHRGQPVFWLRNVTGENGQASLVQSVVAGPYRGKRVRFSGWIRTREVSGTATLFLGAADARDRYLTFNNLEQQAGNAALHGTVGWTQRAIVIAVPETACSLAYGMALARGGEARFAGFSLETVGADVALTTAPDLAAPVNLDFAAA